MEVTNIIEGHANLALKKLGMPNEEVELMATLRERICRTQCTANNGDTFLNNEDRCTACNCKMEAKWRAIGAKCPVGTW